MWESFRIVLVEASGGILLPCIEGGSFIDRESSAPSYQGGYPVNKNTCCRLVSGVDILSAKKAVAGLHPILISTKESVCRPCLIRGGKIEL
jgi:hypothetical protein